MENEAIDSLLSGSLDRLIPLPKRVVRLFISSTFTDMTLERNSLMERVYPKLKNYCREQHGLDFQVVDMRWGVRDEATDDHQTVNLCSREIRNCQRMSLGPNFVALIGDKYGFRPLCNRIKSFEYRALRRCLIELDVNTDFLDTWYKEDLNAMPAEYLLQPISSILKNFTNKNEPELQSIDQRIWLAIQERIHELLLIGSSRLVAQGRLSEQEQLMRYSISVTEREVIEGCLDVSDAKQRCLVYVRSIRDLHDHLRKCLDNLASFTPDPTAQLTLVPAQPQASGSKTAAGSPSDADHACRNEGDRRDSQQRRASLKIGSDSVNLTTSQSQNAAERRVERNRKLIGRFIDLVAEDNVWKLDKEAQVALTTLKERKITSKFRLNSIGKNFNRFNVSWHEQEGVSLKSEEHRGYLQDLTDHFYKSLVSMIRKSARSSEQQFKSGLLGEVLQHSHYANHASKTFVGRDQELAQIRAYILGDQSQRLLPMFIYGVGGSGKTSFLARSATSIGDWLQQQRDDARDRGSLVDDYSSVCLVSRFCGTTPSSSSMVGVLSSVCRQLQYNFYQFGSLGSHSGGADHCDSACQLPFEPIPDDFVRLVFIFRQLLDNCRHRLHKSRLFVIILDSLEHLSPPADNSAEAKFSWLTSISRLPMNVRLIISCSSDSSLSNWRRDFAHLKGHFIKAYLDIEREISSGRDGQADGRVNSRGRLENHAKDAHLDQRLEKSKSRIARNTLEAEERLHSPRLIMRSAIRVMRNKGLSLLRAGSPTRARNLEASIWIIHIKPLGSDSARRVLQTWLGEAGRNLSQQQWSIVEKSFACCSRPIFVKLALSEVLNWKSYSMQSDTRGLTFGSSLLEKQNLSLESMKSDQNEHLAAALARLSRDSATADSCEYRWQLISMEQEWLSYLDHKSREASARDEDEPDSQPSNQMTIRVGVDDGAKLNLASSTRSLAASSPTSICHLSTTINDAISQLFTRIEVQHGFILTKHSLSYLTAARNGICENELEDLLSLDDVVLDDVFQYHLPPVRRIPPLLWARIRSDLPDYLSERDADGIVVNWHHSQFREVAERRYLSAGDRQQVTYIHSMMADYFLGKWADRAKPFKCTKQQVLMAAEQLESAIQQSLRDSQSMGRRGSGMSTRATASGATSGVVAPTGRLSFGSSAGLPRAGSSISVHNRLRGSNQNDQRFQWMQAKADRRVPHQPLFFGAGQTPSSGEQQSEKVATSERAEAPPTWARHLRRYNLRKLTELPHHLVQSGRFTDLANEVLFNYKWLFCSLDALGLQNVLSDFDAARRAIGSAIANLKSGHVIATQTNGLGAGGDALSSLDEEDGDLETLEALIRQMDLVSSAICLSCSAIAHGQTQMLAPQLIGRLLPVLEVSMETRRATRHLRRLLDQCDRDGCLDNALLPLAHCLQSPDGLQSGSLEGHSFAVMAMALTHDQRHLLAVSNKFIMWDISTGELSRVIEPKLDGSIIRELKLSADNQYAVAYTSSNLILLLDVLTQQLTSFKRLTNLLDSDGSAGQIKGLELIDREGATRFVVWTDSSWFLLSVADDDIQARPASHKVQLSIKLEFSCRLTEFRCLQDPSRAIHFLNAVEQDRGEHVVLLGTRLAEAQSLNISTFRVSDKQEQWTLELWSDCTENVSAFCVDDSLKQLYFVDHRTQHLYLRRRRQNFWSTPKCLLERTDTCQPVLSLQTCCTTGDTAIRRANDRQAEQLRDLEQVIDGVHSGGELERCSIYESEQTVRRVSADNPSKLVVVMFYETSVMLIEPGRGDFRYELELPKEVRNIQVEPGRCQMQALVVESHQLRCLVLGSNRKLLFYSLHRGGQLLKSVEAHGARIVQLLQIERRENAWRDDSCLIASASMDKSVKVWNLQNLFKDSPSLDKLDSPVESICLSSETSLAVCLARKECGIFDWRTMRLLTKVRAHDLANDDRSRIEKCAYSSNGRYLCFATREAIYFCPVNDAADCVQILPENIGFKHKLRPGELVRKVAFFQQDARILATLVCAGDIAGEEGGDDEIGRRALAADGTASSGSNISQNLSRRVLVLSFSIPDGRLIYTIDHLTPDLRSRQTREKGRLASSANSLDQSEWRRLGKTTRLPVLMRDQAHIVTVELAQKPDSRPRERRTSSSAGKLPIQLRVYCSRDGKLACSIDLSELEVHEQQVAIRSSARPFPSNKLSCVSIGADEFTKLKAVQYLDRQSVVALIDKVKGVSYFVDIHLRQLVLSTSIWSEKSTSDGRLGLSCGSSRNAASGSVVLAPKIRGEAGGCLLPSSLLNLLEMRHCSPIRSLLTSDTLARLSSGKAAGSSAESSWHSVAVAEPAELVAGSSAISCGFSRPNNEYVHYCDQRRRRLLVLRLADGQLIANYRLDSSLVSLNWAADGFVLVAGLEDGSLLSLALVDPNRGDSLNRLAQFPSRKRT